MVEEISEQLNMQEQTLIELEDELEMEISRVIALKNSIDPELIEDLEKIEEGLYVEVKMLHETKKNIEKILKSLKDQDSKIKGLELVDKKKLEEQQLEIDKYKKRSEKLAKQLIQANEEIEDLNQKMESELKKRESILKNEFINKLKDRDNNINEKILESKRREEELLKELEVYRTSSDQNKKAAEEVERVKNFFDKKIQNIKKTMQDEFRRREKNIAEKAIVVYNKKKEKIYQNAIKEALSTNDRPAEVDAILSSLREVLNLADEVYSPDNFFLCKSCGEVLHISQSKCPKCKTKYKL
ncbi:hypothetical protein [[Eubacterium] cellulosolvens]